MDTKKKQERHKKIFRDLIYVTYKELLKDFLDLNPTLSEVMLIEHLLKIQEGPLSSLKSPVKYFKDYSKPKVRKTLLMEIQSQGYAFYTEYQLFLNERLVILKGFSQNDKETPMPEVKVKQITLTTTEAVNELFESLKVYFPKREMDLNELLHGNEIESKLVFPHNQNQLVEVFRRVKYNNYISNNSSEIRDWICKNFIREPNIKFNSSTVYDILSKGRGEPKKSQRICLSESFPYKSKKMLNQENLIEKS